MKKRGIVILVILLCSALVLSSCTGQGTSQANTTSAAASDSKDSNLTAPGEFPIVKESVTLKVFYSPPTYIVDMKTNDATVWLENKTNVKIDWQLAASTEAGEKLNLLLATNSEADMPDVFLTGMSRAQAEAYGSQGVLIPLENLLADNSINYNALFVHNSKLQSQMNSFDGHTYFLPRYYESVHIRHTQKMWMNMEWLDNLNLSVPTTTDEFYTVLKAFKEQDANGNGDTSDEIPYIAHNGWAAGPLNFLMSSFVYSNVDSHKLYLEDGNIVAAYAQEGWREGARYYKKLFDEKLLDNECFSLTQEQAKALGADTKGNRIGCTAGGTISVFDMTDPEIFKYETISPLKGPTGLQQAPLEFYNPTPYFTITSYCENPEVAIRWADCQAIDVVAELESGSYDWLTFWYGPEGTGWRKAEASETGFTGKIAYFKQLFNWGDTLNYHWYENFLINMKEPWKEMMVATVAEGVYDQEAILYHSTVDNYYPYSVDKTIPVLSFDPDSAAEVAELVENLSTYYNEAFTKFVRGEMSLDKDWEAYLKELDTIGLPRLLELYQAAYDRTYK